MNLSRFQVFFSVRFNKMKQGSFSQGTQIHIGNMIDRFSTTNDWSFGTDLIKSRNSWKFAGRDEHVKSWKQTFSPLERQELTEVDGIFAYFSQTNAVKKSIIVFMSFCRWRWWISLALAVFVKFETTPNPGTPTLFFLLSTFSASEIKTLYDSVFSCFTISNNSVDERDNTFFI